MRKLVMLFIVVLAAIVGTIVWADEPTASTTAPEAAAPAVPEWTAVSWLDFAKGQDPLAVFDVFNAQGWELLFINFPVSAHQAWACREVALGKTWLVAADEQGVVLAGGYLDRWLDSHQSYIIGRTIIDRQLGHGWRMFIDNVVYCPINGGGQWAYYNPQSSITHQIDKKLTGGVAATVWDAEGILGGDFVRVGPFLQYDLGGGKSVSAMWWRDVTDNMPDAFRVRCDVAF